MNAPCTKLRTASWAPRTIARNERRVRFQTRNLSSSYITPLAHSLARWRRGNSRANTRSLSLYADSRLQHFLDDHAPSPLGFATLRKISCTGLVVEIYFRWAWSKMFLPTLRMPPCNTISSTAYIMQRVSVMGRTPKARSVSVMEGISEILYAGLNIFSIAIIMRP